MSQYRQAGVTKVGLISSVSSIVTITGSPITSRGDLTLDLATQSSGTILAGPATGSPATPAFRSLAATDIPNLDASILTTGTVNLSRLSGITTTQLSGSAGILGSQLSASAGITSGQITSVDAATITSGTLPLGRLSGITTTQLSATAGITAGQIASVNPSVLTGSGTVPLAGLSGITTTQLSATAGITSGQIASVNPSVLTGSGTVPLAGLSGITTSQLSASAGITSGQIASVAASTITGLLSQAHGGTGIDSSAVTDGQVLIGKSSDHSLNLATLSAGAGIGITNGAGTISIANTSSATVSSVALSLPGIFSVSGSPVTTSGTLTGSLATQTANFVWAGPTSGLAATPTFRALVAADIPALAYGTGTVTSVGLSAPAELSVGSSPVTTTGTLALTWADESANQIFAGPTSGLATTPGFRALVAGDVPSLDTGKITTGQLTQARGGTGLDTSGVTDGQILIGQSSDHTLGLATLSAGAGVTITNSGHSVSIAASGGSGTVTSVGMTVPGILSVSGSPVTTSGTLALSLANESANQVFAGPTSGGATTPTFRSLVAGDVPNLPASQITSGAMATARLTNIRVPLSWTYPSAGGVLASSAITKVFLATSGGTSFSDITTNFTSPATPASLTFGAVNDALYIGSTAVSAGRFYGFQSTRSQAPTWNMAGQWEYWSGSAWSTFPAGSKLTDPTVTSGMPLSSNSATPISFVPPADWATTTVNSVSAYWIRCRVTSFTSSSTSASRDQGLMYRFSNFTVFGGLAPMTGTITSISGLLAANAGFLYNVTSDTYTAFSSGGTGTDTVSIPITSTDQYITAIVGTGITSPTTQTNLVGYITPS